MGEKTNQSLLLPGDALFLVGIGVREARDGARLAAEETVERGPDLVSLAIADSVALGAPSLEQVGSLLDVALVMPRVSIRLIR